MVMVSERLLYYSKAVLILFLRRPEYLSGDFNSVCGKKCPEYLIFFAERPASSVWACEADIVSIHRT